VLLKPGRLTDQELDVLLHVAAGMENDERTEEMAKVMTDHALKGWDNERGGLYDGGYYYEEGGELEILMESKNWWAQAETLNTLLIMADKYPDDPQGYFSKFQKQWNYIHTYLIDHEHGGWFSAGLDNSPQVKEQRKSHIWKTPYHTGRALLNCVQRLSS